MVNEKIYNMSFEQIYPLLINKAVRKGRTKEEINNFNLKQDLEMQVSYELKYKFSS